VMSATGCLKASTKSYATNVERRSTDGDHQTPRSLDHDRRYSVSQLGYCRNRSQPGAGGRRA
jgi:hypothetical protein